MKTDVLNGLIALQLVAEKGSFTAAASEMGVSTSAVSQTIKQLEKNLGCVLLNRTTRSTSLTELGEQFLRQYQPALEQLLTAMEQLGSFTGKLTGTLRINLPRASWPTVIAPVLQGFRDQYPELTVDLYFEETLVDIVSSGFDAGIRPTEITAGDMTGIRISPPFKFAVAASPAYLKKHGTPRHPNDLLQHQCIHYRFENNIVYKRWEFEENGRDISVSPPCSLVVNDALIMADCAVKDMGFFYTPDNLIAESVRRGELVICLDEYAAKSDGYYLYYPNLYQVSPKLRALIDYLKAQKFTGRPQSR